MDNLWDHRSRRRLESLEGRRRGRRNGKRGNGFWDVLKEKGWGYPHSEKKVKVIPIRAPGIFIVVFIRL